MMNRNTRGNDKSSASVYTPFDEIISFEMCVCYVFIIHCDHRDTRDGCRERGEFLSIH